MERYPDIEIYLQCHDVGTIAGWLSEALDGPAEFRPAGRNRWRCHVAGNGATIPVLLIENATEDFSSLWFDSDATPWPRDVDCARQASQALNCEVRCSLGSWQPGDDPDRFLQISADGEEQVIDWPDSGQ
ncbi:hypothetical protein C7446_1661 [Kushneria sinocarnis]|uniref:Uncharacterized protein n=1 Tax=Kushneria sinocarnis TaxID=595502 RepID=A0A420WXN4_9GAMM|nr:hypothetical protein [Kushneria sinocarnis]RKR04453.1 hypothetical protein C7446_1661 [Kushneria sinocarnis]